MNINILQNNNPYIRLGGGIKKMQTSAIKPQEQIRNTTNNNAIDVKNIVSQSERHYFENLFPDSSSLLQNHILFNRSGKITEMNVNKGSLLDAKA